MAKAVPAHQGSLEQRLSKAKPLYHLAASLCSITGWGHAENLTSVQKLRHIPRESNAGDCQVLHSSCLGGRPFGREIWAAHLSIYTDTQKNSRARKTRVEKAEIILLIITYLSWITAVWIQEKGYKNNLFFPFFKAICNPAYCSRNLSLRRSSQINLRISSGCLTWTLITFCWLPWGNLPFVWVFFNCRFRSQRKCVKLYLRGAAMPLLPIDSITVQTLPHRKYYWWCQVVQDQGFWSLGRGSDTLYAGIEGTETSPLPSSTSPLQLLSTLLTFCPCVTSATRTQCLMEAVEWQLSEVLLPFSLQLPALRLRTTELIDN